MKVDGWYQYQSDKSIKSNSDISKSIIEELANIPVLLRKNIESEQLTNQIKFHLVKLGYQQGQCVYTCLKKSKCKSTKKAINKERNNLLKEIRNIVIDAKEKNDLGTHKFRNKEWLFDIHWYNDDAHYCPRVLKLVAESELGKYRNKDGSKKPYPAVKFDFQKLLIANAELRLLVFRVTHADKLINSEYGLSTYFEKAIEAYQCLESESKFLFVCFIKNDVFYR